VAERFEQNEVFVGHFVVAGKKIFAVALGRRVLGAEGLVQTVESEENVGAGCE
jgi:hypothetical protein